MRDLLATARKGAGVPCLLDAVPEPAIRAWERRPRVDVVSENQLEDRMISRTILAALLAAGTAGAALAEVQVKTPGASVKAPAGGVELEIDVGTKIPPSDAWIGRAVYSADNKHLGEVSGTAGDKIYVDVGGFLGIGETRVMLDDDSVASVKNDRIQLKLTEAEAKSLPPADEKQIAPK